MPEASRGLVPSDKELISELPVGLRYFQAVDAMVEDVVPIRNVYHEILVYKANEDQPSVTVLRTSANYLDGGVGKQDEIELASEEKRLQFNAECSPSGEYTEYPEEISEEGMNYLESVVSAFKSLSKIDHSKIYINHEVRMIARKGVWEHVDLRNQEKPIRPKELDEPKRHLPSG